MQLLQLIDAHPLVASRIIELSSDPSAFVRTCRSLWQAGICTATRSRWLLQHSRALLVAADKNNNSNRNNPSRTIDSTRSCSSSINPLMSIASAEPLMRCCLLPRLAVVFEAAVRFRILNASVWTFILGRLTGSTHIASHTNPLSLYSCHCSHYADNHSHRLGSVRLDRTLARDGDLSVLCIALSYGFCHDVSQVLDNLVGVGYVDIAMALLVATTANATAYSMTTKTTDEITKRTPDSITETPTLLLTGMCVLLPSRLSHLLSPTDALRLMDAQAISVQSFLSWGISSTGRSTLYNVINAHIGSIHTQRQTAHLFTKVSEELMIDAIMRNDCDLTAYLISLHHHACMDIARVRRIAKMSGHTDCARLLSRSPSFLSMLFIPKISLPVFPSGPCTPSISTLRMH
ncbi:hypothetical protein BASA61_007304 [Batrachochytrium salamandrivorans]|nr:hypothetical protein BASA62_008158 [Batrachochytrium salamandrivorans]KAH6584699.1 hypothetical protein BASA61_007304 [Batrachochytrium salamandrivorans]